MQSCAIHACVTALAVVAGAQAAAEEVEPVIARLNGRYMVTLYKDVIVKETMEKCVSQELVRPRKSECSSDLCRAVRSGAPIIGGPVYQCTGYRMKVVRKQVSKFEVVRRDGAPFALSSVGASRLLNQYCKVDGKRQKADTGARPIGGPKFTAHWYEGTCQ